MMKVAFQMIVTLVYGAALTYLGLYALNVAILLSRQQAKNEISNNNQEHISTFYRLYRGDIFSSLQGVFINSNPGEFSKVIEVRVVPGFGLSLVQENSSLFPTFYNGIESGQYTFKNVENMESVYKLHNFLYSKLPNTTSGGARKETLLVLTICNQLEMTLVSLKYLKYSLKDADLIILDDHSTDGSVTYLRRKGYSVFSVPYPKGLTFLWNKAYNYAVERRYKYMFYINNDVLIPQGAISEMTKDLSTHGIVVPMTTIRGAGHNPIQSMITQYNLTLTKERFAGNPRNTQGIQDALSNISNQKGQRTAPSIYKSHYRFNGFMFGVNLHIIKSVASNHPYHLFNNKSIMVGQEDDLAGRMESKHMVPHISLRAFCYHYKSATISVAKSKRGIKMPAGMKDIRENLQFYHPELQSGNFFDSKNVPTTAFPSVQPEFIRAYYNTSKSERINSYGISYKPSPYNIFEGMQKDILFYPSIEMPMYSKARNYDFLTRKSSHSNLGCKYQNDLIFAFIISDSDSAGDVFSALELGRALLEAYSSSIKEIRFLRRYTNWYDYECLSEVDVLISLLDAFDLAKAMSLQPMMGKLNGVEIFPEIKPTMITVAWVRNWFHRWISRPYIGNYNIILLSSDISKLFYEDYAKKFGFRSSCYMGCPSVTFQMSEVHVYPANETFRLTNKTKHRLNLENLQSYNRINVQIGLLRLATSPSRFIPASNSHANRSKFYDYGFTGSYHNSPRKISDFDPTALSPAIKGIIVGHGWEKANISEAWLNMSVGSLPYSELPNIYNSIKLLIDDANHVTQPWGSINSRVYDAIATGVLPLTNNFIGSKELCRGEIPTYSNASDLVRLISYYTDHPIKREKLVNALRQCILSDHTYFQRAVEVAGYLTQFGLTMKQTSDKSAKVCSKYQFIQRRSVEDSKPIKDVYSQKVCIGIRTFKEHKDWVKLLSHSLMTQFANAEDKYDFHLKLFLIDTQGDSDEFEQYLYRVVDHLNAEFYGRNSGVYVVKDNLATDVTKGTNGFYGYDYTDFLLNSIFNHGGNSECDWLLLTNGDNMYNSAWLDSVAPYMTNNSFKIILWDFVTHHSRNGTNHQAISVNLKRGYVDLGVAMIQASLIHQLNNSRIKYLPESIFTQDLMARDFLVLKQIADTIPKAEIKIVHQILMFHQ